MKIAWLIVPTTLALGLMCSPYDPTLGETPFRCGAAAPLCPRGYTCTTMNDVDVCLRDDKLQANQGDAGPVDPMNDAGPAFTCSDDSQLEPNNTLAEPTQTPIPLETDRFTLQGLSICPEGDIDVFAFGLEKEQHTIRVDVRSRSEQALLLVDVLDETGASVRSATPVEGSSDFLRAELPEAPPGSYFVQVRAAAPDKVNNYSIDIAIIGQ
jgi:hypothetical protein